MIENSSPMGQFRYKNENDLKERLGHRDPPIGVSLFTGSGGFDLGFEQGMQQGLEQGRNATLDAVEQG